jgi:ABC-2 type transport system permease protein
MNTEMTPEVVASTPYTPGSTMHIMWLIAWRQIVEAVRTRSALITLGFFLLFQSGLVPFSLGSVLRGHTRQDMMVASTLIAFFLLWVGMMYCTPAIGIAAGVFAGDKERNSLVPLLVTPASNLAIFGGKVLGAILPALLYTFTGVLWYFGEIALLFGPEKLSWLPVHLSVPILLSVPAMALFGVTIACVISSRVSTFQSAQNYSSLILMVLWIALSALVFLIGSLGIWALVSAVVLTYILDIVLIVLAAATWRREEVMAKQ